VALCQYPNAVAMLEQVRTWIGHLDDAEGRRDLLADILLQQERLCETLGQRRRQQQIITDLIALLAPRGASSRLTEAYLRQGDLLTLLKKFDGAERALNTAVRLSKDGADRQLERSALRSLGLLRWHQGRHAEALRLAEQALEFDRAFGDDSNILADMANIGNVLRGLGEFDRSRAILEEALAMPAVARDPSGHSLLLHNLASVHRACGDLDAALECLLRADVGMQSLMLPVHRSFHLTAIAHIRLQQGDVAAALQTYQQAVDLSRRGFYTEALAEALRLLGEVQFGIGENAAAIPNLSEAAGLFAQLENTASQTEVLAKAALARERIGAWREAYDNWRAVLDLRQALDDPAGDLEAREGLARATRLVDPDAAIGTFEQALTLATVLSAHPRRLALHNTLGILHWERLDFEAAFRHYDIGLRICRQIGDRVHEGLMLNCLGLALTRLQRYDEARTVFEESVAVNRATSEHLLEAHALTALADVSLQLGRTVEARQLLEAALALRLQLNDEPGCGLLRRRLEQLQSAAG
jgi:tetratricopeptide (TPR) repeat protein